MRGETERQATLLLGLTPDGFVPREHPLRRIKPLVVDVELTKADGRAEREAALEMLERSVCGPATVGADRAYDTRDFVWAARALGVPPPAPGLNGGCPERPRAAQRDRWPDHATCRLPPESAPAQAGRGSLRLDQDSRRRRQPALSRSGAQPALVRVDRRRPQLHPSGPHRGSRRVARNRRNDHRGHRNVPNRSNRTCRSARMNPLNRASRCSQVTTEGSLAASARVRPVLTGRLLQPVGAWLSASRRAIALLRNGRGTAG